MTKSFTQFAEQMSGLVPALLGWPIDQFWQATPDELRAVFVAFSHGTDGQMASPLTGEQLTKLKETYPDG